MQYELYFKENTAAAHYYFIRESDDIEELMDVIQYESVDEDYPYVVINNHPRHPVNYHQLRLSHMPDKNELYNIILNCKISKNIENLMHMSDGSGDLLALINEQKDLAVVEAKHYMKLFEQNSFQQTHK